MNMVSSTDTALMPLQDIKQKLLPKVKEGIYCEKRVLCKKSNVKCGKKSQQKQLQIHVHHILFSSNPTTETHLYDKVQDYFLYWSDRKKLINQ